MKIGGIVARVKCASCGRTTTWHLDGEQLPTCEYQGAKDAATAGWAIRLRLRRSDGTGRNLWLCPGCDARLDGAALSDLAQQVQESIGVVSVVPRWGLDT